MVSWEEDEWTIQSRAFGEIGAERAAALGYPERATSIAFHDQIIDAGMTVEAVADLELNKTCGIAKLRVEDVRTIDPEVGILRDGGDDNPWHGILFAATRKKMKQEKSQLVERVLELVRLPQRS